MLGKSLLFIITNAVGGCFISFITYKWLMCLFFNWKCTIYNTTVRSTKRFHFKSLGKYKMFLI